MMIDIDAEASAGRISAEAFRNLELAEVNGQASAMYWLEARLRHLERVVESGKAVDIVTSEGFYRIASKADLHAFCAEALPDAYACFLRDSG
jgi:hypothetical protein